VYGVRDQNSKDAVSTMPDATTVRERATLVIVTGLPSSGNRLVADMVKRCSLDGSPRDEVLPSWNKPCEVNIWHGIPPGPRQYEVTRLILLTRSPFCRMQSQLRNGEAGWDVKTRQPSEFGESYLFQSVMRYALGHQIEVMPLTYEALVQAPDKVGRYVAEWLGLSWIPFTKQDPIVDGNAKYL